MYSDSSDTDLCIVTVDIIMESTSSDYSDGRDSSDG